VAVTGRHQELWAVVPAKPLDQAKGRLAPVLDNASRSDLARRLLRHTLDLLLDSPQIDRVLVVSRDRAALDIARDLGAWPVAEPGGRGLNAAVRLAASIAGGEDCGALLVIASDLPLLSHTDLALIFESAARNSVVVAPDRHGLGTNAMLLRPPGIIDPAFGARSCLRHLGLARRIGVEPAVVHSPGLSFDLDVPADYTELLRRAPDWAAGVVPAALPA
jgi:2-phospho-L-lactate guanylyltransferase